MARDDVETASLRAADYVLLVLPLMGIAGIAAWTIWRTRRRTPSDFFLSGGSMAWWALGLSLFSSNIGSEHFVGLSGAAAIEGLPVAMFEWTASMLLLLLGFVFAPVYRRAKL